MYLFAEEVLCILSCSEGLHHYDNCGTRITSSDRKGVSNLNSVCLVKGVVLILKMWVKCTFENDHTYEEKISEENKRHDLSKISVRISVLPSGKPCLSCALCYLPRTAPRIVTNTTIQTSKKRHLSKAVQLLKSQQH